MKNKTILYVGIAVAIILVTSIGTYAWLTWSSGEDEKTNVTGNVPTILFKDGADINVSNMGPVLDYTKGEMTSYSIYTQADTTYSVTLNIASITSTLANSNFKYKLQSSTNNTDFTDVASGDFNGATTGTKTIAASKTLAAGETYFRFIVYIDGTVSNPSNMMNNSLKATLNVSAG